MKNRELFNRTIDILVKAYQNDTLQHGYCHACVVGNLCGRKTAWSDVFMTAYGDQSFNIDNYNGGVKELIDSTGYSPYELAKIEYAFETADKGSSEDDWMFNGLMSVVDTLMQIHEANTDEVTEAKSLFVKV